MSTPTQWSPVGWAWSTLGDLAGPLQYGFTASADAADGDARLVRITDIECGLVAWNKVPWCRISPLDEPRFLLRNDDLLFARTGSIEKVARVTCAPRAVFASYLIRGRPTSATLPEWLAYYCQSSNYVQNVRGAAVGIGRSNVNASKLAAIPVPVAPLAEQRRIIEALETHFTRLEAAVATLERVRANLRRYRAALLGAHLEPVNGTPAKSGHVTLVQPNEPLPRGWRWVRWSEIGRSQNGRAFPSKEYSASGVRLLRPGNLHVSGAVQWNESNTRSLPRSWADGYPAHVVGGRELVMNLTAQSLRDEFLGRVCMTSDGERCLLNQRIARLVPTRADPRFAFWVFKGPRFRRFVDRLNKGSLIQHMFTSQLDAFEFPLPTADEQVKIAARLDAATSRIDHAADAVEAMSQRVGALRQSLLRVAFEGRLVPQDPQIEPADALLARIHAARVAVPSAKATGARRRGRPRSPRNPA